MGATSQLDPALAAHEVRGGADAGDREALSAGDKMAAPVSQSSSIDSEMQHIYEKQRDTEYARQLRVFYKSLSDNLSKETMAELSNEAGEVCMKIDDA